MTIPDAPTQEWMIEAFQEIIDLCNTHHCTNRDCSHEQWMELIDKIDEVAHRGAYGGMP